VPAVADLSVSTESSHSELFVYTTSDVRITFDAAKSARNERQRGLPFDRVERFDFARARYAIDDRRDYGETRYVAVGLLEGRLHVLCFTETADGIRVISFRKANAREVRRYEQEAAD
jgi:hypothetical protein